MRIVKVFFLALMLGMAISLPKVYADETSETILKILIKKGIISQTEVEEMKTEIAKVKPAAPETIEARVAVLEEKVEEKGFLSIEGAEFQLAGELEYEFVNTGRDGSDNNGHLQMDKFVLQPKVKIGDNLSLDAQIYLLEDNASVDAYLNEVHAKFSGFDCPVNTWVDVGLYERWIKSQRARVLEAYPMIGTAFWRDDALTLTVGGDYKAAYWMFSVGNGYELARKQVSEDTANNNDILHDNHASSGLTDSLEYGINLGIKQNLFGGNLNLLTFYYYDELNSADISFLQAQFPNYTSASDDKNRFGLSALYKLNSLRLTGQYITAQDGELGRNGFSVEAGYHLKLRDGDWFSGIMPVVAYGEIDIDSANDQNASNPLSWDRQKTTIASIIDLYKNTKLKLEYYINDEDSGGDDISNNEFLAQLEVKF